MLLTRAPRSSRHFSLLAATLRHARSNPQRTALIDDRGPHSASDLVVAVNTVAARLRDILPPASKQPQRVAALFPRSLLHVAAQHAAWAVAATHIPLSPQHTVQELSHLISDSRADVVLHHPSFAKTVEQLPRSAVYLPIDYQDLLPSNTDSAEDLEMSPLLQDKTRGGMIVYTSGTTGKPKGVLTTFANIEAQVDALINAWEWTSNDRIQLLLPLHHVHGIINVLNCSLYAGAVLETSASGFNALSTWNRWMSSTDPPLTLSMAVPTIYAKMLECYDTMDPATQSRARDAASRFRLMVSGSAALPASVFDRWENVTGHRLLERYGMTEIGMGLGNPYRGERRKGTVGRPFPGVQAMIADDGELLIKGPQVFAEYINRPDATAEVFTADGWFRTGDIARVDEGGVYSILGRASVDIIKSGGHKISALVIEREVQAHEAVVEVAVVGVPDEVYGENVAAVIVLKGESKDELDKVKGWIKERVAKWEVPRLWKVVDALKRNALGKVNKKELVKEMFPAPKQA